MNNQQRQQVVEQLKSSNHVLVTVSANPTVDELAASIGLTLAINKMDKHATTVFSGVVPSTIEFLQPEKTIETTTDSLRDFIISLDKSKADKLRYKVEDDVVRIFITPYRTTISDKDLEYSQGDFNVDLVIALGVTKRQDLDKAITAHGRILHDATIITVTKQQDGSDLGSINWQDEQASSFCEMLTSVITEIDDKVLDGQMATSLLTGIIAETDRFKNSNTTPVALSLSSQLMQAGANQQLIAEKLDEPEAPPELHIEEKIEEKASSHGNDGELEIDHSDSEVDKIHIDDNGNLNLAELNNEVEDNHNAADPGLPALEEQTYQDTYERTVDEPEIQIPEPGVADASEVTNNLLGEEDHSDKSEQDSNSGQPSDVGQDLFENLVSDDRTDAESEPTLKQPDSTSTPMMQHEKVIAPPVHPGDTPKSDKPFDPNEAMAEAGIPTQLQPSMPTVEESPLLAPQPIVPEESSTIVPPAPAPQPAETPSQPPSDSLADLEKAVGSPHVAGSIQNDAEVPYFPPPPGVEGDSSTNNQASEQTVNLEPPKVQGLDDKPKVENNDPNAPPPVPPPMTPQFYDADGNNSNPFKSQ